MNGCDAASPRGPAPLASALPTRRVEVPDPHDSDATKALAELVRERIRDAHKRGVFPELTLHDVLMATHITVLYTLWVLTGTPSPSPVVPD